MYFHIEFWQLGFNAFALGYYYSALFHMWHVIIGPVLSCRKPFECVQKLLKCSCQGLRWRLWEPCLQPFKGFPSQTRFWFLWRLSWTISWLIFHKLECRIVEKINILARKLSQSQSCTAKRETKKKKREKESYFLKTTKRTCWWNDLLLLRNDYLWPVTCLFRTQSPISRIVCYIHCFVLTLQSWVCCTPYSLLLKWAVSLSVCVFKYTGLTHTVSAF